MEEINHYSKLDIEEIKSRAIGWMNQFSAIQEISLYRANDEDAPKKSKDTTRKLKYIIAATVPKLLEIPKSHPLWKLFRKIIPLSPEEEDILEYYHWCDGRCRFSSAFSPFTRADVEDFFSQGGNGFLEDWLWVTIPPGDEGRQLLEGLKLFRIETRLLLNSRKIDNGKQSINITQSSAGLSEKKEIDYSRKTKEEQIALAKAWKENGMARREIAKRLFGKKIDAGFLKQSAAMKRVDRLTNPTLS